MTDHVTIVQGGAYLPLFFQFSVNGEAVDLTGASAPKIYMTPRAGGTRKIDGATCTVAVGDFDIVGDGAEAAVTYDATDGVVYYQWAAADLDTAGFFATTFEVTLSGLLIKANGPTIHVVAGA